MIETEQELTYFEISSNLIESLWYCTQTIIMSHNHASPFLIKNFAIVFTNEI